MSPPDSVDYSSIPFPSDRITMADLRRAHPDRFDVPGGRRFRGDASSDATFHLDTIVYLERLIAASAFDRAAGKPENPLDQALLEREDCVSELTKLYQTYGVAKGPNHTEELVRDMEARAAAQVGRGR
jgi:hypothetical protein